MEWVSVLREKKMKNKEIESLIAYLEDVAKKQHERKEPDCYYPYWVCIDCREVFEDNAEHKGHTVVLQDMDHSGVSEWIKCLRWMKEKKNG